MTSREVWIDGARVRLQPAALLGQGGEAEVYDLADGLVLKWWKPPSHPDFDGMPDAQAAAARRIASAPARLRALPGNLPAAVVVPCGLALDRKRAVVGYLMPRVAGDMLHQYGEPRWRREHPVPGTAVVRVLVGLHDAIAGLHRAGVVIGDCNDLNVLVDGDRVHLIDVDSYQLPGFPCEMFSERFVDPRLCDPTGAPVQPHDPDSDWFAYAVMVLRTLVQVGPWGGVHQPADPAKRCPPPARAHRRISVYAPDIVYPRAARPLAILPDELTAHLRAMFETDRRGRFPRELLERVHLRPCPACGDEHARVRCPGCSARAHVPAAVVHGRLRWTRIDPRDVALPYEVARTTPVWFDGGALWRRGTLGPERIGGVLPGVTRAWAGTELGIGVYRAGGYAVGFVFRPGRGVLDDSVALPKLRGQLVDAHATIGGDRAWLWLVTAEAGRLSTTAVVVGSDGRVLCSDSVPDDAPWRAGLAGACAAGPHLFVPTDDGVARVEVVQGALVQTRTFAETAPLVTAGDRLALSHGALVALRRDDALRMELA